MSNLSGKTRRKPRQSGNPPCPAHVKKAFEAIPAPQRKVLLQLRGLIFEAHRQTDNAGSLVEDLRWSQPTYLTEKPVTGTMIRLGLTRDGRPALFFHCQTPLVGQFKRRYRGLFDYEGNRAVIPGDEIGRVRDELAECIAESLTYKLRR